MFHVINLSLSIRCRCTSTTATVILSDEGFRGKCTQSWPWGDTGDGGYIPMRLSLYPWTLLIVIAKAILIGNRFLHSLKGMAGSDGHNRILGIRTVFIEPVTSAALQCSCKSFTIIRVPSTNL
jgi:hypothetical protein